MRSRLLLPLAAECRAIDVGGMRTGDPPPRPPSLLERAFMTGALPVLVTRFSDGKVIEVNPAFTRQFGFPREEALGRTTVELGLHADSSQRERIGGELGKAGAVHRISARSRSKAGIERDVVVSAELFEHEAEPYIVGTIEDLTDRKSVERALLETEERFSRAFEVGPVAMVLASAETGIVVAVNEATERLFGFSRAEIIGKTGLQLTAWADPAEREAFIGQVLATGAVRDAFVRLRHKTGRIIPALGSMVVVPLAGERYRLGVFVDLTERVRAEQAVRDSEARFSKIFHQSPVLMSITDLETGKFVSINDHGLRMTGFTREEVIGKTTVELGLWAESRDRDDLRARLKRGGIHEIELEVRTKSGRLLPVMGSFSQFEEGGRPHVLAVLVDLTEQKRAQEAAAETQERFERVFRSNPVGILVSVEADGRIVDVNEAFLQISGYAREELVGKTALEVGLLADPTARARYLAIVRATGRVRAVEEQLRHKSGELRSVRTSIERLSLRGVVNLIVSVEDITEALLAEELRRASEERYHRVTETIRDAIITIGEDGNIVFANGAVEGLLAYKPAELVGRPLTDLMPASFRARHLEGFGLYQKSGTKRINWSGIELVVLRKDGREVPVEVSFAEMELDGHRVFTGVLRDISERQEAERFRSQTLDIISHEFRTPVTVIQGYADMLASGMWQPSSAEAQAARTRIARSSKHLAFLIASVGEVAQTQSGRFDAALAPTETLEVIRKGIEAADVRRGAGLPPTKVTVAPGAERVQADGRKLVIALVELIDNAVKFSPKGAPIEIFAELAGAHVRLAVRDAGPGIKDELMADLFKPFHQADPSASRRTQGAGMGLALCKALTEAQHGRIEVDQGVGKGATFSLVLPAAP